MAQKDYVRRGGKSTQRRKKGHSRQGGGVSKAMIALAALVLVAFVGGLFWLAHQHQSRKPAVEVKNPHTNGLPPRPEERWRYIKELENRKPGVQAPARPAPDNGGDKRQLTDEQRQLLDQIQADMRQQPTQLNEVPWNGQPVAAPSAPAPLTSTPSTPVDGKAAAKPGTAPAPGGQRWLVQCGSFKNADQAEAVRAQLAIEGFESRISSNEGWQRVVLGPFAGKSAVDGALSRLHDAGHANCIRLLVGG